MLCQICVNPMNTFSTLYIYCFLLLSAIAVVAVVYLPAVAQSHAPMRAIDGLTLFVFLYLRWAYLPGCAVLMHASAHTLYVKQLQQLVLRRTRCIDMSLDCPYLCFAHDFTSIALVSVWICIAPWSSLKDQDLEPKTKRWLLLKRQVQEEARTWGVVTAFFYRLGGGGCWLARLENWWT